MSVQTDREEWMEGYNVLINLRDDLKDLEKKRDSIKDKDSFEYDEIVYDIKELEERIGELEYELRID
jgi:RecJ-like exonuclease